MMNLGALSLRVTSLNLQLKLKFNRNIREVHMPSIQKGNDSRRMLIY